MQCWKQKYPVQTRIEYDMISSAIFMNILAAVPVIIMYRLKKLSKIEIILPNVWF